MSKLEIHNSTNKNSADTRMTAKDITHRFATPARETNEQNIREWDDVAHFEDKSPSELRQMIAGRMKRLQHAEGILKTHTDETNRAMIQHDIQQMRAGITGLQSILKRKTVKEDLYREPSKEPKNPEHEQIKAVLKKYGYKRGKGGLYTHPSGHSVHYPVHHSAPFYHTKDQAGRKEAQGASAKHLDTELSFKHRKAVKEEAPTMDPKIVSLLHNVLKEASILPITTCDQDGGNHPESKHVKASGAPAPESKMDEGRLPTPAWKKAKTPQDVLDAAHKAGQAAHAAGKKKVPAQDEHALDLIRKHGNQAGSGHAVNILTAWHKGWDHANSQVHEQRTGIKHNPINQKGGVWKQIKKKLQMEDDVPSPDDLQKAEIGKTVDGKEVLDELGEAKRYTHKVYTGPILSHDKGFVKKLHHHYPNVKTGTEHVYVHTNHPAHHVLDTLKNKMGVSGFRHNDVSTREHGDYKPDKVAEAKKPKMPAFDQGKEVRAIARERIGQPKNKQVIVSKKFKKTKHKPDFRHED